MYEGTMSRSRIVVGITGTIGSGKGAVVEHLVSSHGFLHFSVRSLLTDIIIGKGMPLNRDSMTVIANELRAKHSPSYIVEQLLGDAVAELDAVHEKKHDSVTGGAIIESIRAVGEVEKLKSLDSHRFLLLSVDADPHLRYDRVVNMRKSETDIGLSFETFISHEERELSNSNPFKQNLRGCIEMADAKIMNNGSIYDLHLAIDTLVNQFSQ